MALQLATIAIVALLAAPFDALAQQQGGPVTYRCTAKDGKKYYGSSIPRECLGQRIEELNARGMVVKRYDAEGDDKSKAEKELSAAKKREQDTHFKEESRRNRALLATYTSEKDLEDARKRALAENQRAVAEVQARILGIKKDQTRLTKELEFYSGKNKPPARLNEEISNAEIDLRAQEGLLEAKKKEVDVINAKYDDDKKRYKELTGRK